MRRTIPPPPVARRLVRTGLPRIASRLSSREFPSEADAPENSHKKEKRAGKSTGHAKWGVPKLVNTAVQKPLQLPPGGEQILSLNYEASYFGDAFLMLNCRSGVGSQFGSCGAQLFGGLALTDSHLRGYIRIQFTPPVNGLTQFTVSLGNGLSGDDSSLAAPHLFHFPLQNSRVLGVPGQLVGGTLDLTSGEVSNLSMSVVLMNSGLLALASVNPGFPQQPVSFPGQYGSSFAQFDQREDGGLDFTFHGTTFLPLGDGFGGGTLRIPLPFAGPSMQFASIPARGTALHPHIHLSTKELDGPAEPEDLPEIPTNTVREFTFFTHNCSFGDVFTLHADELGGPATGRSQMLGRLQIQFGARSGNSVPFAVYPMSPGGVFADLPVSPITEVFPGRLSPGPQGFNEFLRFPLRQYPLDSVSLLADPFDIAVGAVDIRSGRIIGTLLNRGFISQDLFFALGRVEPNTQAILPVPGAGYIPERRWRTNGFPVRRRRHHSLSRGVSVSRTQSGYRYYHRTRIETGPILLAACDSWRRNSTLRQKGAGPKRDRLNGRSVLLQLRDSV